MKLEIKARLRWIKLYQKTNDAGLVCRRFGISRPTLRKWLRRYEQSGLDGLHGKSKKPHRSPNRKVTQKQEDLILNLRKKRKLGARRIQNELIRNHNFSLSLATIHKILARHNVKPLKRKWRKKQYKRYQRPIPGDRVQLDTMKVAPGVYQYTAIDDCSRFRVLGLYKRRTAKNTLLFMERVMEEMPFPIQRIQTDRGNEFFAVKVQEFLIEQSIKFRPIKPGTPHLNGKVERSQQTDLYEFYETADLSATDLEERLEEWQFYYNWHRPHGALHGKSPIDKVCDLLQNTPYWEDVYNNYDPSNRRIQNQNYRLELQLKRLKRSM
jgi:transposase InsO family protein